MNDRPDPLEAELSALCPQPISAELRQRIADRIGQSVPSRRPRFWLPALAASLTAACLAAVAWWWIGGQSFETPPVVVGPARPSSDGAADIAQPTLLAYQRALACSPEELDALLNKHVSVISLPDPELLRVGAFTRSDAALHALLGDD
jgi:hypothetical protein